MSFSSLPFLHFHPAHLFSLSSQELLCALRKPVKECDIAEPLRSTLLAEVNNKLTAANDKPVFNEDYGILAATFTPTHVQSGLAFFHQYVGEALKRSKLPSPDPPTFFYERASPCLYPAVILQTLLKGRILRWIVAPARCTSTRRRRTSNARPTLRSSRCSGGLWPLLRRPATSTSLIDGRS